jgi:LacI family transcriptional regulator
VKEKKKSVRLYDIAVKAGVSVNTVSRALRNKPDVGETTKNTILQLAEELGYALPSQSSSPHELLSIGVLIQDILNPFYARIMQGIDSIIWQEQANLLFGCSFRQELKEREVLSFFCGQHVEGLLIATVLNPNDVLRQLKDCTIPTIFLSQRFEQYEVDYVVNDNRYGASIATEHLIRLGHTRIAHIAGPDGQVSAQERFRGYQDALTEARIEFDNHLVRSCDSTMQSGYYVTKDLLQSGEKISAIFAYNDLVALGAYRAIKEAGLRIPTDLSIVGYDDIEFVEFLEVPLTTVHQPTMEIGRKAAELLFEKIRTGDQHHPQQVVLKPQLVIRGTTSICND